ncbi:MAG TPA: carboxypeptidase-like regulatory domain-containing protein [Candidatus Saccharimonadales bacterium]|nr:carboxypeptidase-like regulatory domain-containing protein [Candidatus Saccharimonadales bacterium]
MTKPKEDQLEAENSVEVAEQKAEGQKTTADKKHNKFVDFLKTKKGITVVCVAALLLVVSLLFAIPVSRYAILGNFVKKQVVVNVTDSLTGKPVSEVEVAAGNLASKTDSDGNATISNVPVGKLQIVATKKYYSEVKQDVVVGVFSETKIVLKMQATGRQVPVKVINKITGNPISEAVITAEESSAKTDDAGEAILVVAADKEVVQGVVSADNYNQAAVTVTVTEEPSDKNIFGLVPSGKIYFLSNRTGTINVMKSNLDGTDPQVVVQGTGKEDGDTVSLLASRDWRYLTLQARRDSEKPKLYLIDTSNDKMTVMDEGDAYFTPHGWSEHRFIYDVTRGNVNTWENKKFALKSFNAEDGGIATLDESEARGGELDPNFQNFSKVYIFGDNLTYIKRWTNYSYDPLANYIYSIKNDGSNKKEIKSFTSKYANLDAKLYKPKEEYFRVGLDNDPKPYFYEYEQQTGEFKEAADIDNNKFYDFYPTFLVSPSGKSTFWYEPRDGKNSLFVGDEDAKDSKEVASLSELTPYGWFSDEYLIASKNGSELFIIPKSNPNNLPALKMTDYYRTNYGFTGYGYGYGGF